MTLTQDERDILNGHNMPNPTYVKALEALTEETGVSAGIQIALIAYLWDTTVTQVRADLERTA